MSRGCDVSRALCSSALTTHTLIPPEKTQVWQDSPWHMASPLLGSVTGRKTQFWEYSVIPLQGRAKSLGKRTRKKQNHVRSVSETVNFVCVEQRTIWFRFISKTRVGRMGSCASSVGVPSQCGQREICSRHLAFKGNTLLCPLCSAWSLVWARGIQEALC